MLKQGQNLERTGVRMHVNMLILYGKSGNGNSNMQHGSDCFDWQKKLIDKHSAQSTRFLFQRYKRCDLGSNILEICKG